MIKLYGHPLSDYATKLKIALLEKKIDFEEIKQYPSRESDYVKFSYTGRIPVIETENGVLGESSAILEFIEEEFPAIPLLPENKFERARIRQVGSIIENYIDLPARKVYAKYVAGKEFDSNDIESARIEIERAIEALNSLNCFESYTASNQFSFADCIALAIIPLVNDYLEVLTDIKVISELNNFANYYERIMSEKTYMGRIEKQRKLLQKAIARVRK